MKVFIADDSELMRDRLVRLLEKIEGTELVGQAENCEQAKSMIGSLAPDVVILDIRMPGGSGIDVLKSVKEKEHSPLVVILTNYSYPQYEEKCRSLGADYFFDKSFDYQKLGEQMKALVKEYHAV